MGEMEKDRKTHPLSGLRIVITREISQAKDFARLLEREKAMPVFFPVIAFKRLKVDLSSLKLEDFHWIIFTSVNGVIFFFDLLKEKGLTFPQRPLVAAIGPATAKRLQELGVKVSLVPERFVAEGLLEYLRDVKGKNILIPRAKVARDILPLELKRRGANVKVLPIYETVLNYPSSSQWDMLKSSDVITFTSPSTVENFLRITGEEGRKLCENMVVASIGPITTEKAVSSGIRVDVTASKHSINGLIESLKAYYYGERE